MPNINKRVHLYSDVYTTLLMFSTAKIIMLKELLKLKRFSFNAPSKSILALPESEEESMSALKIVHAGGFIESYYMAIPAAKVMEKYPSFLLTKPEVFKRPWDSVVRPDKILTPGEKYFVVPRRTVKKLRRKIQKPNKEVCVSYFESQSSNKDVKPSEKKSKMCEKYNNSSCSVGGMKIGAKKHVTFAGIDVKQKVSQKSSKRRERNYMSWQPSLTSISESLDNDE